MPKSFDEDSPVENGSFAVRRIKPKSQRSFFQMMFMRVVYEVLGLFILVPIGAIAIVYGVPLSQILWCLAALVIIPFVVNIIDIFDTIRSRRGRKAKRTVKRDEQIK